MAVSLCLVTGIVLRPDGTAYANGEVTFASVIPQVVQGTVIPATNAVATTDASGNLNGGAGISLVQGLAITVALSLNGNFNSQFTTIIPNTPTSTFANIASGILSLNNPLPVTTGTLTPVLTTNGTQPAVTYGSPLAGNYVEIGGTLVIYTFMMAWSAQAGGTGAEVGVTLPFPVVSTAGTPNFYGPVQCNSFTNVAGYTWYLLSPQAGTSFAAVIRVGPGAATGLFVPYSEAPVGAGFLAGTVSYRTI